jgi:hypothetical protein
LCCDRYQFRSPDSTFTPAKACVKNGESRHLARAAAAAAAAANLRISSIDASGGSYTNGCASTANSLVANSGRCRWWSFEAGSADAKKDNSLFQHNRQVAFAGAHHRAISIWLV